MIRVHAIEAAVKAIMRRHGHREDNWKDSQFLDQSKDLVAVLEALGIFEPEAEPA